MTRFLLTALVIVAFATVSAQAITVDGSLSDWGTLLRNDRVGDRFVPGGVEILRYGVTVESGTFYAVYEINEPTTDFGVGAPIYVGAFFDVDHSTATGLNANDGNDTYNPVHTVVVGPGASRQGGNDIYVEWGLGAGEGNGADKDFSFWGTADNMWNVVNGGVPGAVHSAVSPGNGTGVYELSIPLSAITNALASFTDGVAAGPVWDVRLGIQGNREGTWAYGGYDGCDLIGDANWDNTCNVADLTKLLNSYNSTGKAWEDGDFNMDGTVNVSDLTALLNNYNKTNDLTVGALQAGLVSTIPEPSSIVMLASLSALLGAWGIRRRVCLVA